MANSKPLELTEVERWPIAEDGDESPLTELMDDLVDTRAALRYVEDQLRFFFDKRRRLQLRLAALESDLAGAVNLEQCFVEVWQ